MKMVPVRWKLEGMEMASMAPFIEPTMGFDYEGVRYAVRAMSYCLNREGEWEFEPMPSSRTVAFLNRCRFKTYEEAVEALLVGIESLPYKIEVGF